MQGNPFSPHYVAERERRGDSVNPRAFSAFNVALYRRGDHAWSLREGAIRASNCGENFVVVGASSLAWEGDTLVAQVDQRTTPFQRRLRGRVTFHPAAFTERRIDLARDGEHAWWPVAPMGAIDVCFENPRVRFRGLGYHDANMGMNGLADGFRSWNWSRAATSRGASLTYDAVDRAGHEVNAELVIDRQGRLEERLTRTAPCALPRTAWGIPRFARSDSGVSLVQSLEDGPFYARALVQTQKDGERMLAMHEVLDATRLSQSWVRFLTPFRMGRAS